MKILGMDSSGLVASVAIVEDGVLLAEYTTDYKKTHSQTLLPMLDEIKRMIELDMTSIDAIATSAGPGSFTRCGHGEGIGTSPKQTHRGGSHFGGTGMESVGHGQSGMSHDGCQKKSGVHCSL